MFKHDFSKFKLHSGNIYSFRDITIPTNFYPNLPYIFRACLFRDSIDMNTFILIVGNPRTSKSFCAMKIAEEYLIRKKKKFDVEKQLTLSDVKKFIIWSKTAKESIFILDETGTTLSPDLFWSLQQRIMRRFVQTQGFRRNILIWVLPSIVFIQKGFRFMSNYAIKTIAQGYVSVNKIVVDQLIGKGYPDFIENMRFGLPSEETIEKYKNIKEEWNDKELDDDIAFLNELDKGYEKLLSMDMILKLLRNNIINREFALNELFKYGYNEQKAGLILDSIQITTNEQQNKLPEKQLETIDNLVNSNFERNKIIS